MEQACQTVCICNLVCDKTSHLIQEEWLIARKTRPDTQNRMGPLADEGKKKKIDKGKEKDPRTKKTRPYDATAGYRSPKIAIFEKAY